MEDRLLDFSMSRLDQALVDRGLCESREKAKRAVMAGIVRINGQPARKPSDDIKTGDALSLDADYLRAQLRRLQFRRGTELVSRAPSTDRLRGRLGRCRPRLPDGRPACARAARGPSPGR